MPFKNDEGNKHEDWLDSLIEIRTTQAHYRTTSGSKIGQIVLNVPPDLLQFSLVGPFLNFLECLAKIYLNWLIYITKKKILAKVTIQTMDWQWSLTGVISIV